MATIEECAERWVRANYTDDYIAHQDEGFKQALIEAYVSGATQGRLDEAAYWAAQRDKDRRP